MELTILTPFLIVVVKYRSSSKQNTQSKMLLQKPLCILDTKEGLIDFCIALRHFTEDENNYVI